MWELSESALRAGVLDTDGQMQFVLGYAAARAARRVKIAPVSSEGVEPGEVVIDPSIEQLLDEEEGSINQGETTPSNMNHDSKGE